METTLSAAQHQSLRGPQHMHQSLFFTAQHQRLPGLCRKSNQDVPAASVAQHYGLPSLRNANSTETASLQFNKAPGASAASWSHSASFCNFWGNCKNQGRHYHELHYTATLESLLYGTMIIYSQHRHFLALKMAIESGPHRVVLPGCMNALQHRIQKFSNFSTNVFGCKAAKTLTSRLMS